MAFVRHEKVRFGQCDPAGIVFYPRYFEMLNASVEDWFAARLGHSFAQVHGPMGGATPTAAIEARFTAPSRLGDELEITLRLVRLGRSSAGLAYRVACREETRLTATSTLVYVGADGGRPRPWPEALREALEGQLEAEG